MDLMRGEEETPCDAQLQRPPQGWLGRRAEMRLRERFLPLGYSVEIATNAPGVLAAARESFGHVTSQREATGLEVSVFVASAEGAVCPGEPARRSWDGFFTLIADGENWAQLDLRTGGNLIQVTEATLKNRTYFRSNFLEKAVYLLLGATVVTDLHAACVGKGGKGILLSGPSGAGKSTLAYACARAGWTYTSDDTSYLINGSRGGSGGGCAGPRVIGHCHRARFRPAARGLFPELAGRALSERMEGKPSIEVPICELPVEHTAAETEIGAIVFLDRERGDAVKLTELPRGAATVRLRQELYSAGEIRERHARLLGALWDVPAYELHYRSLDDGIAALERLVETI